MVRDSSKHLPPLSIRFNEKQARLVVPTIEEKIKAQLAARGVGFLPQYRIRRYLQSGELVELPVEGSGDLSHGYMAWNKNNSGAAVKWFVKNMPMLFECVAV